MTLVISFYFSLHISKMFYGAAALGRDFILSRVLDFLRFLAFYVPPHLEKGSEREKERERERDLEMLLKLGVRASNCAWLFFPTNICVQSAN